MARLGLDRAKASTHVEELLCRMFSGSEVPSFEEQATRERNLTQKRPKRPKSKKNVKGQVVHKLEEIWPSREYMHADQYSEAPFKSNSCLGCPLGISDLLHRAGRVCTPQPAKE